eukprot:gb/GFBE01012841.1/.p1 GENE.gb/GFBE01012841.1/~~gb/GFBE01012841.1/.p1  ORF type:complete len:664 (+),score=137.13 gb/GFBE01012841.1/:1-1992(+)
MPEDLASAVEAASKNGESSQQGKKEQPKLAAPAISLSLFDQNGTRIEDAFFANPLRIEVPIPQTNETVNKTATCAYWDEDNQEWSEIGVETVSVPGASMTGLIECSTTHLSIFGGVLKSLVGTILKVLQCSTAPALFSAEGFAGWKSSVWLGYTSTIGVFVFLAFFAGAMSFSFYLDRKDAEQVPVRSRHSLLMRTKTEEEASAAKELQASTLDVEGDGKPKADSSKRAWLKRTLMRSMTMADFGEVDVTYLLGEVGINKCVTMVLARRTGTDPDSVKLVLSCGGVTRRAPQEQLQSVDDDEIKPKEDSTDMDTVKSLMSRWNIYSTGPQSVTDFLNAGWCKRVFMLFPALHKWLQMLRFNLFVSHTARTALIMMKLTSAAATSALFFSGSSFANDSDPDCQESESALIRLYQAAVVGLLSALMGDILIAILYAIQQRRVEEHPEWTEERKKMQIQKWNTKDCIFWLVYVIHTAICVTYSMTFLANVSSQDASKWLESTGITLLQDLVLTPLIFAILLGTAASLILCCRPAVKKHVRKKWVDEEGEAIEVEAVEEVKIEPEKLRDDSAQIQPNILERATPKPAVQDYHADSRAMQGELEDIRLKVQQARDVLQRMKAEAKNYGDVGMSYGRQGRPNLVTPQERPPGMPEGELCAILPGTPSHR